MGQGGFEGSQKETGDGEGMLSRVDASFLLNDETPAGTVGIANTKPRCLDDSRSFIKEDTKRVTRRMFL
jgi:hypothetical protein